MVVSELIIKSRQRQKASETGSEYKISVENLRGIDDLESIGMYRK
jgi:hypothetical protein